MRNLAVLVATMLFFLVASPTLKADVLAVEEPALQLLSKAEGLLVDYEADTTLHAGLLAALEATNALESGDLDTFCDQSNLALTKMVGFREFASRSPYYIANPVQVFEWEGAEGRFARIRPWNGCVDK